MLPISKSKLKQQWTPSEPAFRRFLQWLDEGEDSNGERYLEMRGRLVRYFDRKECSPADDLADETLNRVVRRLEEEGTIAEATPAQYCYIVAKYVFFEHVREARPLVPLESEPLSSASKGFEYRTQSLDRAEKLLGCLEGCLEKLFPADREMILEYYRGEQREKIQNRRQLAERLALTTNALGIRACRIRDRLERCVMRCAEEG
ncbi:MAG TPA: hypothetical protein VMG31_00935 [Verrucomicrobiae bacterium]|nr:hypothetical protein [Verrucomicrobiae bacterium]